MESVSPPLEDEEDEEEGEGERSLSPGRSPSRSEKKKKRFRTRFSTEQVGGCSVLFPYFLLFGGSRGEAATVHGLHSSFYAHQALH